MAAFLIDNGVEASVEGVGGVYRHLGSDRARVLVFQSDAERARQMIREAEASEADGGGTR